MDLTIDLFSRPDPKPSWDGVYDEEEEMEKFYAYQADQEHEFQARTKWDKQETWLWGIIGNWNRHGSVGAGILLYLQDGEWL